MAYFARRTTRPGFAPNGEIVVMRDADHGFSGREVELGRLIAQWALECGGCRRFEPGSLLPAAAASRG